jgi:spore maturation protein CgeB
MNIAFFGSSLVSAYWNGAATYYRGIVRALADRGHRVTFYESDAYDRQQHRDIPDPPWATVVVYPSADTEGVRRCLDAAASADLVIKASGNGVFDALLESAVSVMATTTCFWDVDAPATLERVRAHPLDPFRPLVPRFDVVLTYGGGDAVVDAYAALGAQRCVPIYNALDPTTHHPVPPDPRFDADVGFLGNRLPDREARVEAFFLRPASALPGKRFLIGGNGWHDRSMPVNVRDVGHVYTRDHNAFNCTTRAVLNVNRESMARFGFSPATRVFEAAGAGACLITDAFVGVERFFEPGVELLVADDGDQVTAFLGDLSPARARSIGQAALRRALSEHTYAHRVELLEQELGMATAGGVH